MGIYRLYYNVYSRDGGSSKDEGLVMEKRRITPKIEGKVSIREK